MLSRLKPGLRPIGFPVILKGSIVLACFRAFRPTRRYSFTTCLNDRPERRISLFSFATTSSSNVSVVLVPEYLLWLGILMRTLSHHDRKRCNSGNPIFSRGFVPYVPFMAI